MTPTACNFRLSEKYSGLYHGDARIVEVARRFEAEFSAEFPSVSLLRVDEYLVGEWYRAVGREWLEFERPVEELLEWLLTRDSHWHWLTPQDRPG